ncbi:MAG: hypothetical protein ACRCYS_18655 [Beijerinckiaceae bacterium]
MSGARTEAACLADAMAAPAFSAAVQLGYLEGAVETAIGRLEYDTPKAVSAYLADALERMKGLDQ